MLKDMGLKTVEGRLLKFDSGDCNSEHYCNFLPNRNLVVVDITMLICSESPDYLHSYEDFTVGVDKRVMTHHIARKFNPRHPVDRYFADATHSDGIPVRLTLHYYEHRSDPILFGKGKFLDSYTLLERIEFLEQEQKKEATPEII